MLNTMVKVQCQELVLNTCIKEMSSTGRDPRIQPQQRRFYTLTQTFSEKKAAFSFAEKMFDKGYDVEICRTMHST